MIPFVEHYQERPKCLLEVPTGWRPCEMILADLLNQFNVRRKLALEFGVEYGFSTSALASYFDTVIAVDHFRGDEHAGFKDSYEATRERLKACPNVAVECFDYREWTAHAGFLQADLIHIDIVHTFLDTYTLGKWAVQHAPVVLFHDTLSFPAVRIAVELLATEFVDRTFYNHDNINGLGILVGK